MDTIELNEQHGRGTGKKIFTIILVTIFIAVAFGAGFGIGKGILKIEGGKPVLTGMDNDKDDVDFGLFWEIWDLVDEKYNGNSDYQNMIYGSIEGMISSLSDPYSVFMDPDTTKEFMGDLDGSFGGIGAEVSLTKDQLTIVSPLKGSPAEKAGIKAGDLIMAIDGEDTSDMTLGKAVSLMRGDPKTEVVLTIIRESADKPLKIKIIRDVVEIESIKYELKKNKIAYVELARFADDTTRKFDEAIEKMKKDGAKKMVLDLRNNPGGYLDTAVEIVDFFLEDGVVVKEEFGDGSKKTFEATKGAKLDGFEIVILINKGSASGSEIVAGALKDYDKAYLIGETSFGKGSVQDLEEFSDGSSLRLTVAKWLTPDGIWVHEKGIEPDLVVEISDNDAKKKIDRQLEKALEYLK